MTTPQPDIPMLSRSVHCCAFAQSRSAMDFQAVSTVSKVVDLCLLSGTKYHIYVMLGSSDPPQSHWGMVPVLHVRPKLMRT